jgi:branched-subunit amino acid transport protein
MLVLTVVQQDMGKGVRLITLAVLPGPLLATCVSGVVWVLTHSLLWGIVMGVASYVLAMITALPMQDLVISMWNRAQTIINQLRRINK